MIAARSAIYLGRVGHTRFRPRRHALAYGVFMLLLDLDELQALDRSLRWFSLGRFNLLSFHARDHGDGSPTSLRTQVEGHLRAAGLPAPGAIRLLCLPRVLGYVFNPISLYFCHDAGGELTAVLYEVSSTFGERHSYLAPVEAGSAVVEQNAVKRLHVSPFLGMALTYAFRIQPPGEKLRVAIDAIDDRGVILAASFTGRRRPLNDRELISAWLRHPLLTLKVMAAIHWEAVKLMAKGLRLLPGARAPLQPVSLGAAGSGDAPVVHVGAVGHPPP